MQGKLLNLLARSIGARSVLEFGTLAAYSTIWLGRALPADARLITLESNPRHAEVARANVERAGLAGALIVADNVVRDGTLADASDPDPATQAQRRLHETLAGGPPGRRHDDPDRRLQGLRWLPAGSG